MVGVKKVARKSPPNKKSKFKRGKVPSMLADKKNQAQSELKKKLKAMKAMKTMTAGSGQVKPPESEEVVSIIH